MINGLNFNQNISYVRKPSLNSCKTPHDMSRPTFGAGKVHLWFDFDGTFWPDDGADPKPLATKWAEFLSKVKDDVVFNITTGRNRTEFRWMKKHNPQIPQPDHLVSKNGGERYLSKPESNTNFSPNPDWPSSIHVDKAKRAEIKDKTSWDGNQILIDIKEVLEDLDFTIILAGNGNDDYGDISLGDFIPDNSDKWFAFIRQDGTLNFTVGFPETMKTDNVEKVKQALETRLTEKGVKFSSAIKDSDWEFRHSHGHVIELKPEIDGTPLNKTYDIKKDLQAIDQDDLIIVGGNGCNDYQMLNAAEYQALAKKNGLPLFSIIVGDDPSLKPLHNKKNVLKSPSPFELLDTVKKAISQHAKNHEGFRKALSPQLLKQLDKQK